MWVCRWVVRALNYFPGAWLHFLLFLLPGSCWEWLRKLKLLMRHFKEGYGCLPPISGGTNRKFSRGCETAWDDGMDTVKGCVYKLPGHGREGGTLSVPLQHSHFTNERPQDQEWESEPRLDSGGSSSLSLWWLPGDAICLAQPADVSDYFLSAVCFKTKTDFVVKVTLSTFNLSVCFWPLLTSFAKSRISG